MVGDRVREALGLQPAEAAYMALSLCGSTDYDICHGLWLFGAVRALDAMVTLEAYLKDHDGRLASVAEVRMFNVARPCHTSVPLTKPVHVAQPEHTHILHRCWTCLGFARLCHARTCMRKSVSLPTRRGCRFMIASSALFSSSWWVPVRFCFRHFCQQCISAIHFLYMYVCTYNFACSIILSFSVSIYSIDY